MSEQAPHEMVRWSFNEQGTLGDIELPPHEVLGQGSQAFVLYGTDPGGNEYAVKIHQSATDGAKPEQRKASEAFRREAKILEELKHPNIIGMYGSGVHYHKIPITGPKGEQVDYTVAYDYIVTEFAAHGSVADRIRRLGPERILPPTESALVLLHASAGLIHAHANGVVHGDMKPSNIMLLPGTDGLVAKDADFGIARGGGDTVETELGTALRAFSAPYASAHQLEGGLARERDDIYALGITGYYLFTGDHPIKPQNTYHAEAHRSTIVRPMEPKLLEGREIVEELNPAIMPIFQQGERDFTFPYSSMGEFQDALKKGLGRAEARAARATTFILLNGTETTWPMKSDDLLHAELPVEGQEAKEGRPVALPPSQAASAPASNEPVAGTPELRIDEFAPLMPQGTHKDLFDVTTAIVNTPSDTKNLMTHTRRQFLKFGTGIGALAAGAVVAGVWIDPFGGEKSIDPAEQERINRERKAVVDMAYSAVDYVTRNSYEKDIPDLLRELIPYDPARIEPYLEKIAVDLDSTDAAMLASYLVPYNPAAANRFMQDAVNSKSYGDAIRVAICLASFAQTPAGKDGNWEAEVQKVRKAFADSNNATEEKQKVDQLLNAALNPRDPSALDVLKYHSDNDIEWAVEVLGAAMAPHNPDGVAEVFNQRIEAANRTYEDNVEYEARGKKYKLIDSLGRSLVPYAPDAVTQGISRIRSDGKWELSTQPSDAQMRLAVASALYKPEAATEYVKANNKNLNELETHHRDMTTLIALSATNADFVRTMRPHITDVNLYSNWIDFGLNPTEPTVQKNALDILKTITGVYVSDIKYVVEALLLSRQPKVE